MSCMKTNAACDDTYKPASETMHRFFTAICSNTLTSTEEVNLLPSILKNLGAFLPSEV